MTFPCYKCNGTGQVAFKHIANGVCFTCSGSGQLSYRKAETFVEPHPELVIPEASRSTVKQWDYLSVLCQDDDRKCRKFLTEAGATKANQMYVSRAVMSRALNMARAAR